jgi:hypothetical protein
VKPFGSLLRGFGEIGERPIGIAVEEISATRFDEALRARASEESQKQTQAEGNEEHLENRGMKFFAFHGTSPSTQGQDIVHPVY